MKSTTAWKLALSLVIVIALVACTSSTPTVTPLSDQNLAATVDSAVLATTTAEARIAATVDAAVPTPTPVATLPEPTPTLAVEVVTLSEEELAALIDEAVDAAIAASETATTATTDATSDDILSQQEVDEIEAYVAESEAAIEEALALVDAYYGLYADIAEETLAVLQAIEQDLNALAQNTAAIETSLDAINATLQQGLVLAQETIDELEAAAATAREQSAALQTQAQNWLHDLQAELDERVAAALAVQPTDIATDAAGAIHSAFAYLDTVRASLGDNALSQAEMSTIAQAGANATASLKTRGGPELQSVSDSINALTTQLSHGELPQAKLSLESLSVSLPEKPAKPSRP